MLPRQLPDGADVLLPATGGALYNTAIALGRLGVETGFCSGLSTDMFGRQLEADLKASNVDASFCVRSDRPTTLAFVELQDGNARYTFYDENTAGRMLEQSELPDLPASVKALHFGAISLIPEPCGSAFEALMAREASGRVISFDPNIRANFIPDADRHRARMERMIVLSDIVKVSDEDLEWIAPGRSQEETIEAWLDSGVSIIVVTRGADGARAWCTDGRIDVPVTPVKVVDTVGAGDSFDAGLLASLKSQGHLTKNGVEQVTCSQLEQALNVAAAVASIVVSRAGANPPWAAELADKGLFVS